MPRFDLIEIQLLNVIDFKSRARQLKDRRILLDLSDAGLSDTDLSILSLASNRAFSQGSVPRVEEASKEGYTHLRYLHMTTYEDDKGQVFEIGPPDRKVISYIVTNHPLTFDWHEPTGQSFPLVDEKDPGQFVTDTIIHHLIHNEHMEEISLLGFMAMDVLYFACNSTLNPLNLQLFPGKNLAGLIHYDPDRRTDIALICQLDHWVPTEQDLSHPDRQLGTSDNEPEHT